MHFLAEWFVVFRLIKQLNTVSGISQIVMLFVHTKLLFTDNYLVNLAKPLCFHKNTFAMYVEMDKKFTPIMETEDASEIPVISLLEFEKELS